MGASAWAAGYLMQPPDPARRAARQPCAPRPSRDWTRGATSSSCAACRARGRCRAPDGRTAAFPAGAGVSAARAGPGRSAVGRAPGRPSVRRSPTSFSRATLAIAGQQMRGRRREAAAISRSSATASSAARSWATPPTSTSCFSTTTRRRGRARRRYARLAQRLNTWLTSTTAAGRLYDTDLRLRPDGASGPAGVESGRVSQLSARAGVDLGAPGADARALRRRRRGASAPHSKPSATRSCVCRAIAIKLARRHRRDAQAECTRRIRTDSALFDLEARSGRHGRRRVRRAVSGARAQRTRIRTLTRNAGNIALLALCRRASALLPADSPSAVAGRLSRIPAAAAPGSPSGRSPSARRGRVAQAAASRGRSRYFGATFSVRLGRKTAGRNRLK